MRRWVFWEWVAYAALFVAAMIVAADTGVRIAPDLATYAPAFVHGAIWGFAPLALVVGATIILLFREFFVRPNREKAGVPQAIPTSLRLQFFPNSIIPACLGIENIWSWYSLCHIFTAIEGSSPQYPEGREITKRQWSIFLVFDRPVAFKQIIVNGNGVNLPMTEVKERGPRHAVITIGGDIGGAIVDINAIL